MNIHICACRSPLRLRFIKKKMRISPYEIVATSSEGAPMTLAQARYLVITPGRLQRGRPHHTLAQAVALTLTLSTDPSHPTFAQRGV